MSDVVLRDGAAGDHSAMADLWVAAWRGAMPAIDFDARRTWFVSRLSELEASGARITVAVDPQGSLLGFVTVDPVQGYIDQLAVLPSAQRRGLAGRLLAEARRISPDRLALDVNQDNAPALLFYRRQGFRVTAEGVNPRSGLPVWRMEWRAAECGPDSKEPCASSEQARTFVGGV